MYQPQLERWRSHFPRDRMLILQSEPWFEDPSAVMNEVCRFLGLPEREELPRVMRNRNKPHDPFDAAVIERLREFYRPWNERLADYLGMDLSWNRSTADPAGSTGVAASPPAT